jgi:hypothetical protein
MKSFALLAVAAASVLPSVLAHGFVPKITVNGKEYIGPKPWAGTDSIIRRVDNTEPNHIQDGKNLACGKGAATRGAKLNGKANPGDTLSFAWDGGDGSPWPHDSGPLITYMAKCDGDCSSMDATKAKFFKIDQIGKTKTPGNEWYQDTILHKGKEYDVKLPEDLPSGDYLIRHEIIALHLADQTNGAEFYPSCSQWTIGGSNTGTPSVTTTFPGGYKAEDAGIHINIWDKTGAYPFPGPAIATFSGSSASGSNTGSNSTSSSSNNNSSVSDSPSDDNSDDNSSSDDGYSSSNDANDDSGNNDSNSEDGECDDEGDDTNDNSAASGTNDANSDNGACDASTNNVVYETVTVTKTVLAEPTAKAKGRLARDTSSATRRSRSHHPRGHSS